ncbi:alpha/beta fold hydrolase [Saccharopolyspora rhizosphaerae]|uniref:Alpha/beta fold hydrolase n=1 Tax=Saccharopolyspora rhizosphaerae TaxID=2492662 RepID=A0A426K035_9PSEU|nr:alpha/beta hydrolase [Saccharopolyspora rhizosphaerae]RRO18728.1 alpha/beta fold hydrolase [Saccharopolyspora rhizosphaerae]
MSHSVWRFGSQLRRGAGGLRPVGRVPAHVEHRPDLPPGEVVHLPGRGEVFVRRHSGPGHGVPVVLLHGVTWSADINFHGVFDALSRHHPVVALDQRGRGRGLPITGEFGLSDMADDVIALLDELGIDEAVLCGCSLGSLVALHAALGHRDRVAGLVLCGAALCYRRLLRDRLALAAVRPAAAMAKFGFGKSLAARYFGANRTEERFRTLWPWLRAELARTPPSGVTSVMRAVADHDLRSRAHELRDLVAVVVLTTHDTICNPALQEEMAAALDAQVVRLDRDHDVPLADPDAYRDAVVGTLSRLTRADARA